MSIPKREAQVETISPFVNQPWKSCGVTFATFYLSKPSQKKLPDFKARRKRFYLLMGNGKILKEQVGPEILLWSFLENATYHSYYVVFKVI